MYQRDYLLKQIEMMGQFLRKVIARMQQLPDDEPLPPVLNKIKAEFQAEMGFDPEEILSMNDDDFLLLLDEKKFNDELLDTLAEFYLRLGESDLISLPLKLFARQKSLAICNKIESRSNTFSMQRSERIRELYRLLQTVD